MKMMTVRSLVVLALGCVLWASAATAANEESWVGRLRVIGFFPAEKSDPNTAFALLADDIQLDDKVSFEADIEYFFDKQLSAELALPVPHQHGVSLNSTHLGIGKFDIWSPTLTLKYHFEPDKDFRPYIGLGVNYSSFSDVQFTNAAGVTLDSSRWGTTIQLGCNWAVGERSFVNLDFRKVLLDLDLQQNKNKVTTIDMDPFIVGLGYGFRL